MTKRKLASRYVAWFVFVFAFGFVMRAGGLLLHEFGGHGIVAFVAACGLDSWDLTYFGYGSVRYTRCDAWTPVSWAIAGWAGLIVCLAFGLGAATYAARSSASALARFCAALIGFFFLIGQLRYVVVGGFFRMGDPGATARALDTYGLTWLLWGGALAATLVASLVTCQVGITALRESFAPRDRLRTALVLALVVGTPGLLFATCLEIEHRTRGGITGARGMREAQDAARLAGLLGRKQQLLSRPLTNDERTAIVRAHRPFPIGQVQLGVAGLGLAVALARRNGLGASPRPFPAPPRRAVVATVATAAALACLIAALTA